MNRVLIVEDDPDIRDIVCFNLKKEGYEVCSASDGTDALDLFEKKRPDLVLLDIMIPGMNGLAVLDTLREKTDIPILIMSAKITEEDRINGLSRMADDYICKPFSVKELMMRVKVHLARYTQKIGAQEFRWGEFTLNERSKTVSRGEEVLPLSAKEVQMMLLFARHPGKAFSREELVRLLWDVEPLGSADRTVDVAIRRLREKIGDDAFAPRYIVSRRGLGYMAGKP